MASEYHTHRYADGYAIADAMALRLLVVTAGYSAPLATLHDVTRDGCQRAGCYKMVAVTALRLAVTLLIC